MADPIVRFWERPQLAAQHLLRGDPATALRAGFSPGGLTPEQSKSPAESLGIKGFMGGIFDLITDPFVIIAALTSFRFPIPKAIRWVKGAKKNTWSAKNMFDVADKMKNKHATKDLGMMWWARSPHANFYGTEVPDAMSTITKGVRHIHETYLGKFGDARKRFEMARGRTWVKKDSILLSAALEELDTRAVRGFSTEMMLTGNLLRKLPQDKAFKRLVKDWRGTYDDMWNEIFRDETNQKKIVNALRRLKTVGDIDTRSLRGGNAARLPRFYQDDPLRTATELKSYFKKQNRYSPHIPARTSRFMVESASEELIDNVQMATGRDVSRDQMHLALNAMAVRQVSKSAFKRSGIMIPSLDDLELIKEYVNPKALRILQGKIKTSGVQIQNNKTPGVLEYSLHAEEVASHYVRNTANMYAWTLKGGGDRMMDALDMFKETGQRARHKLLQDTYLPQMMGKMTFDQALSSNVWGQRMKNAYDTLQSPTLKKVLPKGIHKTLSEWTLKNADNPTVMPGARGMAGYFYTSTLGMNLSAAFRNLGQMMLPQSVLGTKYTIKGIKNMSEGAMKYFKFRARGVEKTKAFQTAFPAYAEAGIGSSPYVEEAIAGTLHGVWDNFASRPGLAKTVYQKSSTALMSLFQTSEIMVRLSTFEGAFALAMKDGAKGARALGIKMSGSQMRNEAIRFARKTTEATQFLSGPVNTPYFAAHGWTSNPLVRQFLQYPSRFLEFTTHTGTRLGAGQIPKSALGPLGKMVDATPGLGWVYDAIEGRGYNPGVLSRQVMWSWLAGRAVFEAFDVDLAGSLMPGSLALPREWGPFAPMPIIPPAIGLVGAIASDFAGGELKETRKAFATLVPGGVMAARAATGMGALGEIPAAIGKKIAMAVGTQYVDYSKRTGDGRYPVFTAKGGLIGYATAGQLFMRATGVAEGGAAFPAEGDLYRYILSNRDTIRASRKGYIDAIMRGDIEGAEAVDAQFQKQIPDVGTLRGMISEKDINDAQLRLDIPRLEKLLDTLPPQVRAKYAKIITDALMNQMGTNFLGVPPESLGAGTSRSRRPQRMYPTPTQTPGNNLSPLGAGVKPSSISQQSYRLGPGTFSGFESLSGFEGL